MRKSKAFTLIELLVVIGIILIIMALFSSSVLKSSHKKEIIGCAANLKKLGAAFHMYVLENDGYAPFNPNAHDNGDYFWSWEAIYLLGPYLGDGNHEKFYNGELDVAVCPGNRCKFYETGNAVDFWGNTYDPNWQNRQAPLNWPADSCVPNSERPFAECSLGRQRVDYMYNVSLGGTFKRIRGNSGLPAFRDYYENASPPRPRNYKLDFVLRFPEEAVIFCDIQYDLLMVRDEFQPGGGVDKFIWAYQQGSVAGDWQWDAAKKIRDPETMPDSSVGPNVMGTNQRVHYGKGINAVFVDGHVEFLPGNTCYTGDGKGENRRMEDDLLNWGITYPRARRRVHDNPLDVLFGRSYPVYPGEYVHGGGPQPEPSVVKIRYNKQWEIPGVHGYRRCPAGWCICHEYDQGFVAKRSGTDWTSFENGRWGDGDCFGSGFAGDGV